MGSEPPLNIDRRVNRVFDGGMVTVRCGNTHGRVVSWKITDDDGICSDCNIIGQFHTPDNPGTAS